MMSFSKKVPKGFTLIEMMVSIALFSIVMTVVATAYLNLLNLDRQAKATNDASASLSFIVDTMSRSIRTGTNYQCNGGANCAYPSPQSSFTFVNDQGKTVTYSLDTNANAILECYDAGCTPTQITYPTRIKVTLLNFYVSGVDSGNSDSQEPEVTMVIQGSINIDTTHAPVTFDIQTSATQRQIDI